MWSKQTASRFSCWRSIPMTTKRGKKVQEALRGERFTKSVARVKLSPAEMVRIPSEPHLRVRECRGRTRRGLRCRSANVRRRRERRSACTSRRTLRRGAATPTRGLVVLIDRRFAVLRYALCYPSLSGAAEYIDHVKQQARRQAPIRFVCRYAMVGRDDINFEEFYVFLVPDEGFSEISKLHAIQTRPRSRRSATSSTTGAYTSKAA